MKTTQFIAVSLLAGFAMTASAIQATKVRNTEATQVVTVSAKRMSEAEKRAFDLQSSGFQTVVISAKRLTPEQKAAIDRQDREWQAAAKK